MKEVLQTALSTNLGKFNDTGCVIQYVGYSEYRIQHLDQLTCELQISFIRVVQKKKIIINASWTVFGESFR